MNKAETVIITNLFQAVFDCNSCHRVKPPY
jgi:hypothetical protein